MTGARLAFVFALCVISNFIICASEILKLETQSIFYGLALTASKRGDRGTSCQKELSDVASSVVNNTRWAIKLLDASGVPQSGLYWGGTFWLGSQSQCKIYTSGKKMSIAPDRVVHYPDSIPPFPIAYYAAYFKHDSNIQKLIYWKNEDLVTLGLCLPNSCSEREISELLQEYFNTRVLIHQHVYNMTITMEGVKKTDEDMSWIWTPKYSLFLSVSILLILFNIVGTIYSTFFHKEPSIIAGLTNGKANGAAVVHQNGFKKLEENDITNFSTIQKILLGFSINRNIKKVFDLKHEKDVLLPFNGIRTMAMCLIVYGHIVIYGMEKYEGKAKLHYSVDEVGSQIFQNASLIVDTFYCISGFLLGYTFFKKPENNEINSRNLKETVEVFLHGLYKRFMRLTPLYMYVLLCSQVLGEYIYRTSSIWNNERMDDLCSEFWWTNLLYINNIYPGLSSICLSWGYYLSNDMQFYIVTSLLLYMSRYYFKLSALTGFLLCAVSVFYTAYIVNSLNFQPFIHRIYETVDIFYFPTWMRISPYIIGVFGAYLYYYHRDRLPTNKLIVSVCWVLYLVFTVFPMFGVPDRDVSISYSMLYLSTSRPVWSIASVWLMIACLTNRTGIFGTLMSMDLWIPPARLTYCAYLINPALVYFYTTARDKNLYFDEYGVLLSGMGLVVAVFFWSLQLVILVEYPVDNLINVFSKRSKTGRNLGTAINSKTILKQD